MKSFLKIFLLCLCCSVNAKAQKSELLLKWGLAGSGLLFEEQTATLTETSAIKPKRNPKDKLYRFFTPTRDYNYFFQPIAERHNQLWEDFNRLNPSETNKQLAFEAYQKKKDPYLEGSKKNLAPSLYFDFIGMSGKVYVLQSIIVQTINFEEYRGGGFVTDLAWYDILLRHTIGVKDYSVAKKLKLQPTGRVELRFFSDNFYPSMSMAPMGCYTLKITFNFVSDQKKVSVSTGKFKMDV